jgi:hypothetical protein
MTNIYGYMDLYTATNWLPEIHSPVLESVMFKNIRASIKIGSGNNTASAGAALSLETLINTFMELWDVSSDTSKTYKLTMNGISKGRVAEVYVKLVDVTDELLAEDEFAAEKIPCVVCESTDEGAMLITDYATAKGWTIA